MTVTANQANRYSYSGDGTTKAFAYGSKFLADADLTVLVVAADGTVTTKTLTTDYTVSGAGDDTGGTVTFGTAPADGETVVIFNDPEIEQPVDLVDNDGFEADTVEGAFDRNVLIARRTRELTNRTLVQSDADADAIGQLPVLADREVSVLAFDASGDPVSPSGSAGQFLRKNAAGTAIEFATVQAGSSVVSATESQEGIAEIATQTEVDDGTDDTKFVTPKKLAGQIATQTEVNTGTDDAKLVTPETLAGQIATQAEVVAGASDSKFITPKKLAGVVAQSVTAVSADKTVAATDFPGVFNCTAAATLSLGDPADVTPNLPLTIINSSTGVLTVTPLSGDTIDGVSANYTVPVGSKIVMISDGAAWRIISGAQHAGSVLQVVAAKDTGSSTTGTSATAMTNTQLSITPKSTKSKLLIVVSAEAAVTSPSGATHQGVCGIEENTTLITNDHVVSVNSSGVGISTPVTVRAVETNDALTARTFGFYGYVTSGGTLSLTNQVLSVTEIAT
jgi:hypothetical protein